MIKWQNTKFKTYQGIYQYIEKKFFSDIQRSEPVNDYEQQDSPTDYHMVISFAYIENYFFNLYYNLHLRLTFKAFHALSKNI